MTVRILDGQATSARIREEIAAEVARLLDQTTTQPHLVAVLVGDDPASQVYVGSKERACQKAGIKSTVVRLPADIGQSELLDQIAALNRDTDVHGILVQLPLPKQIDQQAVLDAVDPAKDVDAFHPDNVGRIVQGRPRFLPCTPHGIQKLLTAYDIDPAGKHAVVLGRSEIVGKPMAIMLMQKGPCANATVTVCHSRTQDIIGLTRQADILIAAIGIPRYVTANMVKPGAVVIDVGINRTDDGLVGDVDFAAVSEVASAITPVPKGVGPMTIAMVLNNTLTAAKLAAGV